MAVHNGGSHLSEALTGILSQEFEDFEFLIVDDGSTDETSRMLAAVTDPRVRVLRHDRMGLTPSLSRGLALASGEYVARQDADDTSRADRLEKQVAMLDATPEVALVGSAVTAITEDGRALRDFVYSADHGGLVADLSRLVSPLPHTTIMFRRNAVVACGGYRAVFVKAQDYDLYLRLSEAHRLASIPEPLCRLRVSTSSVTHALDASQFRYAVLARVAAVMRRERGGDPLERPGCAKFLTEFHRWYASSAYPRKFSSRLLRREARLAWGRGRVLDALWAAAAATYLDPGWLAGQLGRRSTQDESAEAVRWVRRMRDQAA